MKITLKVAATLDGKIATKTGESQWITGKEARLETHRLRHQHDAILVGINTVLADDPKLTTRGVTNGKSPVRIIMDSQGRIPEHSQCLNDDGTLTLLVSGCSAIIPKFLLKSSTFHVLQAPTERPEITWMLQQLSEYGIGSILVEGGAKIHASFIQSGCVNRLVLFLAPKVIGGNDAFSWCGELDCLKLEQAAQWEIESTSVHGKDLMICANFVSGSKH